MKCKIIFIGNSIVAGYPFSKGSSFVGVLRKILKGDGGDALPQPDFAKSVGFSIVNKGVNGDTTAGIAARLQADVLEHEPDVVFVMTGTNDFIYRDATPEEAFENLEQIAARIEALPGEAGKTDGMGNPAEAGKTDGACNPAEAGKTDGMGNLGEAGKTDGMGNPAEVSSLGDSGNPAEVSSLGDSGNAAEASNLGDSSKSGDADRPGNPGRRCVPVYITPIPVDAGKAEFMWMAGCGISYDAVNRDIDRLSELIRNSGRLYVDMNRLFAGYAAEIGDVDLVYLDGLHPLKAGHEFMAGEIVSFIEQNLTRLVSK